ncbi:hypothetical protein BC835DRAFT_1308236 [Cytidiella melzeri]|nr:hypothetical protein BC835DRAFT_1308236 [Cytidiella melzeri]
MPARLRSANYDFSIQGDELENNRIQLEHNLQHTDISLHLSSAQEDNDYSDVEYARHNFGPPSFDGFASFDHHSRDHFDPADENSQYNAWSYRTMDDEEGIDPYEGRTMSTAAHHASALTLSAGLGGRGSRREASLSGAEYDPDRPLQGIIAGFGTRIPGLDADSTKSRQFVTTVDFDPLVVDDSAELERVLPTRRPAAPVPGLRSPSSCSSSSRPATPLSPRPKLSDTLHQVAFSPKRPRNGQSHALTRAISTQSRSQAAVVRHVPQPTRKALSATRASVVAVVDEDDMPTPKSRTKSDNSYSRIYQQSLSYAAPIEPEVNVLPPTPPNAENTSKFTRLARGLAKELEDEQSRRHSEDERPAFAQSTVREKKSSARTDVNKVPLRSVLSDLQDRPAQVYAVPSRTTRTPMKGKLYLPDVTGLTNIVASPAKFGPDYLGYEVKDDGEIDVRLATTLNVVQSKLAHLESENSISRRRVRELELELEECKRQVTKERTRVLEREQVSTQHHTGADAQAAKGATQIRLTKSKDTSGLRKAVSEADEEDATIGRYKEAVEEKKALEALISTLRAHLSRLTAELSEHHKLLQELRTLRDSDVRALKEKSSDVDQLRQEVERLGGEVEVLRGVVEEGLKERREIREMSMENSRSPGSIRQQPATQSEDEGEDVLSVSNLEDQTASGRSSPSPRPSPVRKPISDGTIQTDQATMGSPKPGPSNSQPFVTSQDLNRILEEVSERRSERSASGVMDSSQHSSGNSLRGPSSSRASSSSVSHSQNSFRRSSFRIESDESGSESVAETAPPRKDIGRSSPSKDQPACRATGRRPVERESAGQDRRPASPTATRPSSRAGPAGSGAEAPFPQIRGEYLESLFFSAPEHNANTCTVCHRKQRARSGRPTTARSSWAGPGQCHDGEDDEGFAEGQEDAHLAGTRRNAKGKEREKIDHDDRVPPQTVVARVLRELEDDFTHYKSIYVELADQYKDIDPVSNVAKRNVLAEHLREVIDILEQKGDQIASLYDLLTYKDKPLRESVMPDKAAGSSAWSTAPQVGTSSWTRAQTRKR